VSTLSKDVVIRLLGDANSAVAAQRAAAEAAEVSVSAYRRAEREQSKQARAAEKAAAAQRAAMDSVGRGAMIFGAVVAAGLALSTKAAIDWETAWAGVQKTVNGTPAEMDELEASLRRLATTLPATHEEIAAVAEAAGQLGIKRQDVVEFTEVAIAMGVATNLSSEEAATSMARLSNIMGTSASDVDRMGSAIVELGNNGATTEGEILDMGLRIGAAGRQAGMSAGDVLGLAQAMSSLGIQAEAGGTAISTVIKDINSAVLDGGDQLESYARVAGVTADEFATAWRDDAASALVLVVEGLARMQARGENVNGVISDLGLGGIRTSDTLLRLAGNADGVAAALTMSNKAWADNNALMNEANQRYETNASKIQMARNQLNDAAIDIGGTLLPVLASGVDLVADLGRGFTELPDWMKDTVVILGAVAAGVSLVGGAAILAVPKIAAFRTVMHTLEGSSGAAVRGLGKVGLLMTGPVGAGIGIATIALGGLVAWLGNSSRASEEAADYQRDLASALRESGGAIDDNVRALAAKQAADTEINGSSLLEWAQRAGLDLPIVTDALLGNRDAAEQVDAALRTLGESATITGQDNMAGLSSTMDATASGALEARDAFGELTGSMGAAVAENQRLADAQKESGDAAERNITTMDALGGATDDAAGSAEGLADAAERLVDLLDELNGPTLDVREATRGYQDALDKARASLEKHGKTLDITTDAGRANADALDRVATSAMEQAKAILNNTGSYDAFRNSLESSRSQLIHMADEMGLTAEEAEALADQILQIPEAHEVDIELPTYRQVTRQLQDVHDRIKGVPPQTWTNVGVISAQAMAQLEAVGLKTRTLPDGTVEVLAETDQAERDLNQVARDRTMTVRVRTSGGVHISGPAGGGTILERHAGGSVWPGQTFLVGEKGPELLEFGGRGHITPADQTARILDGLRQPAAAPSAALAAAPTGGSAGRPAAAAVRLDIDYQRLGAVVAAIADRRPTVGQVVTSDDATGAELAEKLAWIATTRGPGD
jgi:TP901 family phage tail tape measure protein